MSAYLAFLVVALGYWGVLLFCKVRRCHDQESWNRTGRIVIPATFHNPGWFLSHIVPLVQSGCSEVIVVTDEPLQAIKGVRFACPPKWIVLLLGRALSKLVWTIVVGIRAKPDVYMGYHIIPSALTALFVGHLFSRATVYQMTAGPVEVIGGGYGQIDNPILRRLGRPSTWLERLAMAVVRKFDLVVVRGSRAQQFLSERGVTSQIAVIPGSVNPERFKGSHQRSYDLLFVGQLIERKQPLEFVEIIAAVEKARPSVRAAISGDGPLAEAVQQRVTDLGLTDKIEFLGKRADVETLVAQARVFVLPSLDEGLSIALAEAMMAGAVPVVTDVGDLGDLVRDGANGYLVELHNRQAFISRIEQLLGDMELWSQLSCAAVESARTHNGIDHVTARWGRHLQDFISKPQANEFGS